jgi:hypothetical protein
MKKIGFRRKISIDWGDPGVIFTTVFLIITLLSSGIVTFFGNWSKAWPCPLLFGIVTVISLLVYLATKD